MMDDFKYYDTSILEGHLLYMAQVKLLGVFLTFSHMVLSSNQTGVLSGLICVQTVCKGYQQSKSCH